MSGSCQLFIAVKKLHGFFLIIDGALETAERSRLIRLLTSTKCLWKHPLDAGWSSALQIDAISALGVDCAEFKYQLLFYLFPNRMRKLSKCAVKSVRHRGLLEPVIIRKVPKWNDALPELFVWFSYITLASIASILSCFLISMFS